MSKKVLRVIIIVAALWLTLLIAFALIYAKEMRAPEAVASDDPSLHISNPSADDLRREPDTEPISVDLVEGQWIGDRFVQNLLTINSDGTFTETDFMKEGTFEVKQSYLILTDIGGQEYVMKYRVLEDGTEQLYFTAGQTETIYTRATEEDLAAIQEIEEEQDSEADLQQKTNMAIAYQVLTEGDWKDSAGNSLRFTKDVFAMQSGEAVESYPYQVSEVSVNEGDPSGYIITGVIQDQEPFTISLYTAGEDFEKPFLALSVGEEPAKTYSADVEVKPPNCEIPGWDI